MYSKKIGFLGAGNMGVPILRAVIDKGVFAAGDVLVFDPDTQKSAAAAELAGCVVAASEKELCLAVDVLVLCVKPQVFPQLLPEIAGYVKERNVFVVSIAAGKTTSAISELLGGGAAVGRIFPNLNARVGQAVSAYCVNEAASAEQKTLTGDIAASFGDAVDYPEDLFSVFGVLGGCAPAYTFMFIKALADAAQKAGMDEETALKVASQTVLGSAKNLQTCGETAETMIDRVCSKGGTTIEGVNSLSADGLSGIVEKAFNASLARDRELSAGS